MRKIAVIIAAMAAFIFLPGAGAEQAAMVSAHLSTQFPDVTGAISAVEVRPGPTTADRFNRANENPLGGNWVKVDGASTNLKLQNNQVTLAGGGRAHYYWNPFPATNNNVTAWATLRSSLDDGAAADLGVWASVSGSASAADGYTLRLSNSFGGSGWEIRRITNWGSTVIATCPGSNCVTTSNPGSASSGQRIRFVHKTSGQMEGWRSTDNGHTWELIILKTDTVHTGNFRIGFGHSIAVATSPTWDNFGGGVVPQAELGAPQSGTLMMKFGIGQMHLSSVRIQSGFTVQDGLAQMGWIKSQGQVPYALDDNQCIQVGTVVEGILVEVAFKDSFPTTLYLCWYFPMTHPVLSGYTWGQRAIMSVRNDGDGWKFRLDGACVFPTNCENVAGQEANFGDGYAMLISEYLPFGVPLGTGQPPCYARTDFGVDPVAGGGFWQSFVNRHIDDDLLEFHMIDEVGKSEGAIPEGDWDLSFTYNSSTDRNSGRITLDNQGPTC